LLFSIKGFLERGLPVKEAVSKDPSARPPLLKRVHGGT
jgi:hypothetical protein